VDFRGSSFEVKLLVYKTVEGLVANHFVSHLLLIVILTCFKNHKIICHFCIVYFHSD